MCVRVSKHDVLPKLPKTEKRKVRLCKRHNPSQPSANPISSVFKLLYCGRRGVWQQWENRCALPDPPNTWSRHTRLSRKCDPPIRRTVWDLGIQAVMRRGRGRPVGKWLTATRAAGMRAFAGRFLCVRAF